MARMGLAQGRRLVAACMAAAAGWLAVPAPAAARDVVVFAASSLTDALNEIGARWQRETGNKAVIAYAASSALAQQLDQGAPADVFLSADRDWMDHAERRNVIRPETRVDLLGNRLVLVAEKGSSIAATIAPGFDLAGLLGSGRLAMADVNAVPAGKYGKASLQALGVWASVERKVAQAENVRAALLLVSRGEAPLGIVYRTDAFADPAVGIVATFPENTHPPIVYPAALTARASPEAAAFFAFLQSPIARLSFEKQGFSVLK